MLLHRKATECLGRSVLVIIYYAQFVNFTRPTDWNASYPLAYLNKATWGIVIVVPRRWEKTGLEGQEMVGIHCSRLKPASPFRRVARIFSPPVRVNPGAGLTNKLRTSPAGPIPLALRHVAGASHWFQPTSNRATWSCERFAYLATTPPSISAAISTSPDEVHRVKTEEYFLSTSAAACSIGLRPYQKQK
jgi:hypothetical protein